MTAPAISVLMPVYNCERYLDEAIRSIREQTFADFEFVVVNDGSTDRSPDIIRRHAAEDMRIVVLDQANTGLVGALNNGVALCRGDLIARMDGDDIALAERLMVSKQFMDSHPEVGVLGTRATVIDENNSPVGSSDLPLSHAEIDQYAVDTGWCGVLHPTVMVRTALLRSHRYDDRYPSAEDYDLMLRLWELTRIENLPESMLFYRRHSSSISGSRQAEQATSVYYALKAAAKRRRKGYCQELARLAYRASWLSRDGGLRWRAMGLGIEALKHAPTRSFGVRAIGGTLLAGLKGGSAPLRTARE